MAGGAGHVDMLQALPASVAFIIDAYLGLLETMRRVPVCKGLPSDPTWSEVRSRLERFYVRVDARFARSFGVHVQALFDAAVRPLLALESHTHVAAQDLQGRQVFVQVRGYKRHQWTSWTQGTKLSPTKLVAFFRNPAMDDTLRQLQSYGAYFRATQMTTYHERDNATIKVKRCRLQTIALGFQVDIVQRVFYPVSEQLPDSDAD